MRDAQVTARLSCTRCSLSSTTPRLQIRAQAASASAASAMLIETQQLALVLTV